MRRIVTAALAAGLLAAAPLQAMGRDDAALNQVYETIAGGVAANAADGILGAFADDAIVLDPRPGAPASGEAFRGGIRRMAAKLAADGVKVRSDYRIVSRTFSGDLAIDVGYRRQTMAPPPGGPQPMVQYHKFLVVAQRQRGGGWKILRDASVPASREAWETAARQDGLKFDG